MININHDVDAGATLATGDDEGTTARVAWLYHNDGLTQSEVGERLGLSRVKVSRILDAGRAGGLIQVRINSRHGACLDLEARLRDQFGLTDARVVPDTTRPDPSGAALHDYLGEAAAQYLMSQLRPGHLLAAGWGETVSATIRRLGYVAQERGVSLVSLTGGVRTYVAGMRTANWHCNISIVPAPLLVSTSDLANALMREPGVASLLEMALHADYKLVGIGPVDERATVVFQGFITADEMEPLRRRGAVGDVLCRFFDSEGMVLDLALHDRVVGVSLDGLRDSARVIGAAGGPAKVAPIRAALLGRIVDILVTDESTARSVLEERT